jgi:hypothetical protein
MQVFHACRSRRGDKGGTTASFSKPCTISRRPFDPSLPKILSGLDSRVRPLRIAHPPLRGRADCAVDFPGDRPRRHAIRSHQTVRALNRVR